MIKNRNAKRIIITIILLFSRTVPVPAFTDQTTSERILKENKAFIEFINVSLTNFADAKADGFMKIYEMHFNADVAYLQSDYKRAYKKVYACQGEMVKLYESILRDLYLEDSKNILDRLAPGIIKSKNSRARLYLTLGYRDRTISMTHYTIGEASNPKLFSYKIYKYEEGIKMARRAKRYAFLALFESQNPEVKRNIYKQVLKKEKEEGNPFFNRFLDKEGDAFLNELNVSFEEIEKRELQDGAQNKSVDDNKLIKRVRYRREERAARYLMDNEFDRAEDILRQYVDDFNYKLISATFEVLSSEKKEESSGASMSVDQYKLHLLDNYSRLSKKSAVEGFLDKIKVDDEIDKDAVQEEKKAPDETVKEEKPATPVENMNDTDKKEKTDGK
ncbi:MAG: hypothetical protein CVV44_13540 [Spirochaetae bacterium HGW-Spirochaetae-1]|jgi:hypothetical protein|nr:MAG: hypothetical protein CVV44_13540 [Spirochaetae bacterium HGW-Spirochaetae-1]